MNEALSILVVDDSRDLLELVRRQLQDLGLNPFISDNVMDGIEILENTKIDLLITDLNMPEVGGEQLIRYASGHFPELPILVITGFPSINSAVSVMKMGVLEYLIKPFTMDELEDALNSILKDEVIENKQPEEDTIENFPGIIGSSPKMQSLFKTIERTKSTKATILVSGESGTGKELVARAIHYSSDFSAFPFVPVNCGAIPDQLLESELFGHLKGSFTGAISNRTGFFQAADGGTLFLDEIGNTSLEVQAKLLRAIQEKEVTILGGTTSQKINIRIITASNVNLQELISQGKFREDLYYRLNVISIEIPPLREREGDILTLIKFFNKKFSDEQSKPKLKFDRNVLSVFKSYAWPGNVRELENFMQRLVVMHDDVISMEEVPEYMKSRLYLDNDSTATLSLKEMEKRHILKVLAANDDNKTKAAKVLGIDRKTLREKLK